MNFWLIKLGLNLKTMDIRLIILRVGFERGSFIISIIHSIHYIERERRFLRAIVERKKYYIFQFILTCTQNNTIVQYNRHSYSLFLGYLWVFQSFLLITWYWCSWMLRFSINYVFACVRSLNFLLKFGIYCCEFSVLSKKP